MPAALTKVAPEKCPSGSKPAGKGCIDIKPVFIQNCPGVLKALRYYTKQLRHWTLLRTGAPAAGVARSEGRCPRYLLHIRRAKARAAHRQWNRWFSYHYAWSKWMPDKWQRVGACETGYGRRPGSFTWDSGTYVSFAGIIRGGYSQFAHELGLLSWDESYSRRGHAPTPREQVLVASRLQSRYGWSAWGCGGA